jgi:hypothetical protein
MHNHSIDVAEEKKTLCREDTMIRDHKIKLEKDEIKFQHETQYRCCSGCVSDARLLIFLSQITIAIGVMGFAMVQLVRNEGCESCGTQNLYVGIIMTIVGVFLPQPTPFK